MAGKDYYKILGVDKNIDAKDLKKAFYKKAHTCHPDKAKDDAQRKEHEVKFKELNEAYQILSDPQKRQQYDQFGSDAFDGTGNMGGGGFNWQNMGGQGGFPGGMDFDFGNIGDIFGDIFGGGMGGGRSRRSRKGADLQMQIEITFEEAVHGAEKEIAFRRRKVCSHCKGEGNEPGSKIKTCSTCKGSGKVIGVQNTIFGQVQTTQACSACNGKGKTFDQSCSVCNASGKETVEEKITIKIPAGISQGEMIRMADRGEVSEIGNNYGDLYLIVNIKPHKDFVRKGDDVYSVKEITFAQAVMGDKIKVETIDGEVKLKVPAGTHSGEKFRLKGKGVPHLKGIGKGDHYVEVKIKVPQKLDKKQKKLLEDLDESLEDKNY